MSESAQIAMQGSMPFHRIGVLKLSNITFQNGTLGILPPGKKKQQKFVVGDSSGTVSVFYVKKGNAAAEWQNPIVDKPVPGAPIDAVSCLFVEPNRDKIYAAAGKRIKCFSRKGHVNVSLDVGQDVRLLWATADADKNSGRDAIVWAVLGDYQLSIYGPVGYQLAGFFICPDKINALVCGKVKPSAVSELGAILGCQDRKIRFITTPSNTNEKPTCEAEVDCEAAVTCLAVYDEHQENGVQIVYGTSQGHVAIIGAAANKQPSPDSPPVITSKLMDFQKKAEGISQIHVGKFAGDESDTKQVIIGRDGGHVEIWNVTLAIGPDGNVRRDAVPLHSASLNESIRGLGMGVITSGSSDQKFNYTDFVVASYSGSIVAFSCNPAASDATGSALQDETEGVEEKCSRGTPLKNEQNSIRSERSTRFQIYFVKLMNRSLVVVVCHRSLVKEISRKKSRKFINN